MFRNLEYDKLNCSLGIKLCSFVQKQSSNKKDDGHNFNIDTAKCYIW